MKNLQNTFINYMTYGGITKQEYDEIEIEIREKNRSSLSMASICLVIMFSALFLGSLLSEMMAPNRNAYCATGLCFLLIQILCQIMRTRGKRFITPLWYIALILISFYAIILNTVMRNDISATTFCVILMSAPLLIIDKPWRVFGFFILVTCCFIPIDFHQKAYYLAFTDTVNALCCIFLGIAIHIRIMNTKLLEMLQKRYIEKERDTDKLTGCLTKTAFETRLAGKLNSSDRCGVLMIIDLDHFKYINDSYGHIFGDMILHTMGEYLRQSFPDTALYGRFGGDEFQVWLPETFSRKELSSLLDKFLIKINSVETPDDRVQISASIGVALCPKNGCRYSTLFENADAALYAAKNMGRNRYAFCPEIQLKSKS